MNKIKLVSIAMLLSVSVSTMAQEGFVPPAPENQKNYSDQFTGFLKIAVKKFETVGGLCALLRNSPTTGTGQDAKPMFSYNLADMVPPGYDAGEWPSPCGVAQ